MPFPPESSCLLSDSTPWLIYLPIPVSLSLCFKNTSWTSQTDCLAQSSGVLYTQKSFRSLSLFGYRSYCRCHIHTQCSERGAGPAPPSTTERETGSHASFFVAAIMSFSQLWHNCGMLILIDCLLCFATFRMFSSTHAISHLFQWHHHSSCQFHYLRFTNICLLLKVTPFGNRIIPEANFLVDNKLLL